METKIKRCAIYTRKSHEDGLEQEYNSLDAQRDAAMNYIASQRSNGWQAIAPSYDDGGWSGGNTNRPALQRLMSDIRAGLVDIVVVYKIDRLSRSLTDFAELQTEFDKHGVAFCAITQEINTSTSSGRMMLNILMTFAQFEREVIAERIRDKLSASKMKGKYVGGLLPLGYDGDSETMRIVVNPAEAETVKLIYHEYLRSGSPKAVQRMLAEKGLKTKQWTSKKGIRHGGKPITLAMIHEILRNPIYIGKLRYRDKVYEGEHDGFIDPDLWRKVQESLDGNRRGSPQRASREVKPFAGLIYCGHCNAPMFTGVAVKPNGRRYAYYICLRDDKKPNVECPVHRVPAEPLEKLLLGQIGKMFHTPTMLAKICDERLSQVLTAPQVGQALEGIATVWAQMFPVERYKLLHAIIKRVLVFENEVRIIFAAEGLSSLLREAGMDFSIAPADGQLEMDCTLSIPCHLRRSAGQLEISLPEEISETASTPIRKALVQAHQGMEQLVTGKASTMREIADALKMDRSFVARTLQLANLAPDLIKMIWNGTAPDSLTLDKLRRGIPESWEEQRKLFLA